MKRSRIIINGIVQGVGFRPFVYRTAVALGIKGAVWNSNRGVMIDAEGRAGDLARFIKALTAKAPPNARIASLTRSPMRPAGHVDFRVRRSLSERGKSVLVSPDVSVCPSCLAELRDARNRRHDYPFITCADCGPRFSIVADTPFDRERTSMSEFRMCRECRGEYGSPADRRFHAETISCPDCGPALSFYSGKNKAAGDPVKNAVRLIKRGKIVAVKGLGGFHLVCDAANDGAVRRLRAAKERGNKPFALMCADARVVKGMCVAGGAELAALESPERPIVIMKRRRDPKFTVSGAVAPGNGSLGIMLPYTPLHVMLLSSGIPAIVATSANLSEEPICADIGEVRQQLSRITGYVLDHDRKILTRMDDSVVRAIGGRTSPVRRARGYVPAPLAVGPGKKDILALGAELKGTFTLTRGGHAFVSQHIGDLNSRASYENLVRTIKHFEKVFQVRPKLFVRDMHPDYMSSKYIEQQAPSSPPATLRAARRAGKSQVVEVQHHHAHIASCMAENGLEGRVIGVAFDGLGMGTDGALWGAEFLVAGYRDFKRAAHLKYVPLPGGDAASREPWRMAISWIDSSGGEELLKAAEALPFMKKIDPDKRKSIMIMIEKKINSPRSSSMGRLFDAVSAMLGICAVNSYEGEAASMLEDAAADGVRGSYGFDVAEENGVLVVDAGRMIRRIVEELLQAPSTKSQASRKIISRIAAKFHNTIAAMALDICRRIRKRTGLRRVCLSGGCFQNRYLAERCLDVLGGSGFRVYAHRALPPNDACISFGQACVASRVRNALD